MNDLGVSERVVGMLMAAILPHASFVLLLLLLFAVTATPRVHIYTMYRPNGT